MPTDTLSFLLNGNDNIKRAIAKNFQLKSPSSKLVEDVKLPVKIDRRGEEGCLITIQTFFKEKASPYGIFVEVLDGLAGAMDHLLDLEEEERKEPSMVKEDWHEVKPSSAEPRFSSKFVKKSKVDLSNIPTCPHCDRPLPKSESTDYRRCPFCYEKL